MNKIKSSLVLSLLLLALSGFSHAQTDPAQAALDAIKAGNQPDLSGLTLQQIKTFTDSLSAFVAGGGKTTVDLKAVVVASVKAVLSKKTTVQDNGRLFQRGGTAALAAYILDKSKAYYPAVPKGTSNRPTQNTDLTNIVTSDGERILAVGMFRAANGELQITIAGVNTTTGKPKVRVGRPGDAVWTIERRTTSTQQNQVTPKKQKTQEDNTPKDTNNCTNDKDATSSSVPLCSG